MYNELSDLIVYNWLKKYSFDSSDESFFRDMLYYLSQNPVHSTWAEPLLKKYSDNDGKPGNSVTRIITKTQYQKIVKFFEDNCNINNVHMHPNIKFLSSVMDLSETEELFLNLSLYIGHDIYFTPLVYGCIDSISSSKGCGTVAGLYSRILNIPYSDASKILDSFLVKNNILIKCNKTNFYTLNSNLCDLYTRPDLNNDDIVKFYFDNELSTDLEIEHFPHMTTKIQNVENIINASLKNKQKGTNILLWGVAGTGKTELAISLAKKNNWNIVSVGDSSLNTVTVTTDRVTKVLSGIRMALKLFDKKDNVVLLIDEMEDLIRDDKHAAFSKAYINRTMELSSIPIIWTTNNIMISDRSFLRRMTYNIEFNTPPHETREKVWEKYSNDYNLNLNQEDISYFSKRYDVTPSLIHNATKLVSSSSNVSREYVHEIVTSMDTLENHGTMRQFPIPYDNNLYDLSCVNTPYNLNDFTERLVNTDNKSYSLCLYGPTGTGKSEYAKYLANKLGMPPLLKKASDIISPWVGATEQNIAGAFKEAIDGKKVLIFDEGDTFLQERNSAKNSWEISMVNEMLVQMENHTLPFIITTNLFENIDAASLRRFTFDMKFDFLSPNQAKDLFEKYFGVDAPDDIKHVKGSTPGDYSKVLKKVRILGEKDPNKILTMIEDEISAKKYKPNNPIGF